jgi:molybdopterin adenylyltransferase
MTTPPPAADAHAGDAGDPRAADPSAEEPRIGILTVSDRAWCGQYEDRSGPAVEAALQARIRTRCAYERRIVPDEQTAIIGAIADFSRRAFTLVCTSGGTGPAPRDVTPEAMARACDKLLPGFGEAMRRASLDDGVPTAILSRQTAGIAGRTLVINLPGSPKAIECCLDAVFAAVPDCLDLMGATRLDPNPERVRVYRRHLKGDEAGTASTPSAAPHGCGHGHAGRHDGCDH